MSIKFTPKGYALLALSYLIVLLPFLGFGFIVGQGSLLVAIGVTISVLAVPPFGLGYLIAGSGFYWFVFGRNQIWPAQKEA